MNRNGRRDDIEKGPGVEAKVIKNISEIDSFKDYGADLLVKDAERLAESIKDDLRASQLRRIYVEVKKIEMNYKKEPFKPDRVILLKPRLVYAASKKSEVVPIKNIFIKCIDKIQDIEDFNKFVTFFEAILAYHSEGRRS